MMFGYAWAWPMMLWMGAGALFWLAALALIAWLLIRWLDRRGTGGRGQSASAPTAQETLRQRYARGELDTTTYERMRERLGS